MKAVVVHQYGGPEVLKFEDYPDPVPGPGEVLVRVAAATVNPIDYKRRAGLTKDFYPIRMWIYRLAMLRRSITSVTGRRASNRR